MKIAFSFMVTIVIRSKGYPCGCCKKKKKGKKKNYSKNYSIKHSKSLDSRFQIFCLDCVRVTEEINIKP